MSNIFIRLCAVNPRGEIQSVVNVGPRSEFYEGLEENNLLYVKAPDVDDSVDLFTDYFWNGEWQQRIPNPTTLQDNTLENLPTPCIIEINGEEYPCESTTATLEFASPGPFLVRVKRLPYKDKEFIIAD